MKKAIVIGAYGSQTSQLDGQTVKTRSVYNLLKNRFVGKVAKTDTLEIKRKPWLLLNMVYQLLTCNYIILIPSVRSLTFLLPALFYLSKLLQFDIICICIGGKQEEFFNGTFTGKPHYWHMKLCRQIKAFLPEMNAVNEGLKRNCLFRNTAVFPNFRRYEDVIIPCNHYRDLKIVFMARIRKDKGYPAVFMLADYIQQENLSATITFFGPIAPECDADFNALLSSHDQVTSYGGILNPKDIQKTLSQYDVMVLPTTHYTEGFPGSVLDVYIAGIPVVVTEWEYAREFVDDGETGFVVPFKNSQQQ